jgi:capsular exopolysaccharide synthesis family protein
MKSTAVSELADPRLIVHPDADPVFVEQYRRLGAALHQAQVQRGIRTVMVTSAVAAEGKTLSATNLALTLSHCFKKRVLLVDGDLRKPSIHRLLQIENRVGLSDLLRRPSESWRAQTLTPALSVITGGNQDADPVALLTSGAWQRLLAETRDRFDWVVVDTSPIVLFPDAELFADGIEGCVLVVDAEATTSPAAVAAVAAIGASRILGVVLNRAGMSEIAAGYGYAYGEYGYAATTNHLTSSRSSES